MNTRQSRQTPESDSAKASGEFHRIGKISEILSGGRGARVTVGIGDDAAVLRAPRAPLVWTTDSCVENVHFRRNLMSFRDVGWRSFNSATSDIAAMGAKAVAALSALELPPRLADEHLFALVEGQAEAARFHHCPIAGGNLTSSPHIAVTTTALGSAARPLLRSGARLGDEVWLIGAVGLAAAGLAWLLRKPRLRSDDSVERCVEAYRRPVALLAQGQRLVGRARAAIDVSDGLAGDAAHIAESSRLAIELDEAALEGWLPPELRRVSERLRRPALEFVLFGGDDYALLATGPKHARPTKARAIGSVVAGRGVWLRLETGGRRQLGAGYNHFS